MSSISHYERALTPKSHIKSPGTLFSEKKSASEPYIHKQQIQDLLGGFKSKIASSSMDSFTDPALTPKTAKQCGENYIGCFMMSHFSESFTNPGRLKNESAELSSILFKAKEILSVYDIDLAIGNSRNSRKVYDLLKVIILEVCFFPTRFFKTIQLKQFIICEGYTSLEGTRISVDIQSETTKVNQRIYQIVWDHIIKLNPDILMKCPQNEI